MAKKNKSQDKTKSKAQLCPDCGIPLEPFRDNLLRCPNCGYVEEKS